MKSTAPVSQIGRGAVRRARCNCSRLIAYSSVSAPRSRSRHGFKRSVEQKVDAPQIQVISRPRCQYYISLRRRPRRVNYATALLADRTPVDRQAQSRGMILNLGYSPSGRGLADVPMSRRRGSRRVSRKRAYMRVIDTMPIFDML